MNEQAAMMNQQQQLMGQQQQLSMNQTLLSMNQMNPQPQMVPMNRNYGMWGQQQQQQFQNPNLSSDAMRTPPSAFNKALGPRSNWKGKRVNKQIGGKPRMEQHQQSFISSGGIGIGGGGSGGGGNLNFRNYNPPSLNELQHQNRIKTRKTFQKKKFNKNMSVNMNMNTTGNGGRSAPFAPRNTTSFLIRAKRSGGIAPVVSPFPVTPSVLPTPILSPSTEVLGNMAKEEWGVDGYGSMKGLIRLRSQGNEDEEDDEGSSSSESDVEEHVEVERRLDHDLSRFEMIYDPNSGNNHQNVLENRVDDQDTHIAQLEEENLNLKERLFLMEGELGDLRRRLLLLERRGGGEDGGEEIVENESENERESNVENTHSTGENDEEDRCKAGEGVEGPLGGGYAAETSEGKLESGDEGIEITDDTNANVSIEADKPSADVITTAATDKDDYYIEANKSGADVVNAENVVVDEPCKLVVETDTCMIESEVTKEEKLGG